MFYLVGLGLFDEKDISLKGLLFIVVNTFNFKAILLRENYLNLS